MKATRQGYIYSWEGRLPPLSTSAMTLREVGWLREEESWWFAWCELDIALPQQLRDPAALPDDWDALHLFSPHVEMRQIRQGAGWRRVLLTENPLPPALVGWTASGGVYSVKASLRILWGGRLRTPGGDARGVVMFPRALEYGVAGEAEQYDKALVADVWLYHDAEARLFTERYGQLRHLAPGDDSALVQSLA